MYLKIIAPGVGLLTLVILVFGFVGCSDDSNPTGSIANSEFVLVQEQVNNYLDSVNVVFSRAMGNIYRLPKDTTATQPPIDSTKDDPAYSPRSNDDDFTYSYTYGNGWHQTIVGRNNSIVVDNYADSIQFCNDALSLAEPENLDYLRYIRHWNYTYQNTDTIHYNFNGHINFEFNDLDDTIATVTGFDSVTVTWYYISADSNVTVVFDVDVDIDSITIAQSSEEKWYSGCPASGTVTIDIEVTYTKDSGTPITRNWDITAIIENGSASVAATCNDKTWNYTCDICTIGE